MTCEFDGIIAGEQYAAVVARRRFFWKCGLTSDCGVEFRLSGSNAIGSWDNDMREGVNIPCRFRYDVVLCRQFSLTHSTCQFLIV